jgi:hypothetical protein
MTKRSAEPDQDDKRGAEPDQDEEERHHHVGRSQRLHRLRSFTSASLRFRMTKKKAEPDQDDKRGAEPVRHDNEGHNHGLQDEKRSKVPLNPYPTF